MLVLILRKKSWFWFWS